MRFMWFIPNTRKMCEARDCNRDAGEPLGHGPSAPKSVFCEVCFCEVGSTVLFSD